MHCASVHDFVTRPIHRLNKSTGEMNNAAIALSFFATQSSSLTVFEDDAYEGDMSERREMEQMVKCRMSSLGLSLNEYS